MVVPMVGCIQESAGILPRVRKLDIFLGSKERSQVRERASLNDKEIKYARETRVVDCGGNGENMRI